LGLRESVRPGDDVEVEGEEGLAKGGEKPEPEGADEEARIEAISISGRVNVGRIGGGDGDEDAEAEIKKELEC